MIKLFTYFLSMEGTNACRDLGIVAHMISTLGRSDDARMMYLADLMKPQLVKRLGE